MTIKPNKPAPYSTSTAANQSLLSESDQHELKELIKLVIDDVVACSPNKSARFVAGDIGIWFGEWHKRNEESVNKDFALKAKIKRQSAVFERPIIIGKVLSKFSHDLMIKRVGNTNNRSLWEA